MIREIKKAINEEVDSSLEYLNMANELTEIGVPYYITKYIFKIADDELKHAEMLQGILRVLKGGK